MRNTWLSSKLEATTSFSARALARSWPKGFSTTARVHGPPSRAALGGWTSPALFRPERIALNSDGGTAR